MFCSGCGQALAAGQPVCTQCGRPVAPIVPPVPGMQFELENYSARVKALSVVWFIYAGYSVLMGMVGLSFAHAFFSNHFILGPWAHGPWVHDPWTEGSQPEWLGQAIFHLVWVALVVRAALALITAWGLHERSQWGRIVAIVVAILSLIKFPFGTALGIWTLVVLMGYRNTTLYEQLNWTQQARPGR
jgi:hypothetical protein